MRCLFFLLAFAAMPALAEPLTITKTVTIVSDPVGDLVPRSLPGAVADYRTTAANPLANLFKPVRNIVMVEILPDDVVLRVTDLAGVGKGPVEFSDGLPPTGLTYDYSTSAPTTDGLEFWNGLTWAYQPVAGPGGYDADVRAIRITLAATFATATSFQLRYRTRIR